MRRTAGPQQTAAATTSTRPAIQGPGFCDATAFVKNERSTTSVVDAANVAMITLSLVSNMLMISVRRAR